MPDLQPDTSIYKNNQVKQPGIGDLIGLIQGMRQLGTQSGLSDLTKQNTDPNTGVTNYPAVSAGAANNKDPNFIYGPDQSRSVSEAQRQQFESQRAYMTEAAKALGSLITKPNRSVADFNQIAPLLERYGVPRDMITDLASGPKSGPAFDSKVAMMKNWADQNAALPTVQQQVPGGNRENIPAGTTNYPERPGAIPGAYTSERPGEAEATTQTKGGSGKALTAELDAANNYQRQTFPLRKAIPAMERLGPQGSGEGSEPLNQLKSFMVTMGVDKALGIDAGKVKDFDEAKKYFVDWANQVSDTQTNDRLAAAFSSNPNMKMSNAAAVDVAKSALSLRRMRQVQLDEFKTTGLPDSQFTNWSRNWNKGQDPRAFGFDLMGRDVAKKMLEGMSPKDREKFQRSHDAAERSGVLDGTLE